MTIGILAQLVGQRFEVVGENFFGDDERADLGEQFHQQFAGFVFTLAARAGVTGGDYDCVNRGHRLTTEDTEEEALNEKSKPISLIRNRTCYRSVRSEMF